MPLHLLLRIEGAFFVSAGVRVLQQRKFEKKGGPYELGLAGFLPGQYHARKRG
jgi:hypothetical protein